MPCPQVAKVCVYKGRSLGSTGLWVIQGVRVWGRIASNGKVWRDGDGVCVYKGRSLGSTGLWVMQGYGERGAMNTRARP